MTQTPSSDNGIDPPIVIEDFVIETYDKQQEIPHITVLENTRKSTRTATKDRADSQTLCRGCGLICNSTKPSIPCKNCFTIYHIRCVYAKCRRNFEQGKWLCPNCTTRNDYNENLRANAVIKLRKLYDELHQRPCLPLKMQYKYTDIPFINVKPTRVSSDHGTSDKSEKSKQVKVLIHTEKLPFKCRSKSAVTNALEEEEEKEREQEESRKRPRPHITTNFINSKEDVDSARRKRCRILSTMASEVMPVIDNSELQKRLERVQKKISAYLERGEIVVGKTKVSQNQLFECDQLNSNKEDCSKQEIKRECELVNGNRSIEGEMIRDAHSCSNDVGSVRRDEKKTS